MLNRTLSVPSATPLSAVWRRGRLGGDLQASPDPRLVMRWAILGLSAVAIAVVLLTAEAHLGPGVRFSDVVALCTALSCFALLALASPWQRLEAHWLLVLVGGPIVFVAGLTSLTGAGASPYFALYAPILALAGWYLSGRQAALAVGLVLGTEGWRAVALDHSGSVDHLAIALPFGVAIAATASFTSRWLRRALIETRHEQIRLAETLDAVRSLGADLETSVLRQLEIAASRLFTAQATAVGLGTSVPTPAEYGPAIVDGRTATLLVKGSAEVHALLRLETPYPLSAHDIRLASILAETAGRTLDAQSVLRRTRADTERDALTGLLNRRAFDRELAEAFMTTDAGAPRVALLFVDLNGFKNLNDSHGHAVGDTVLACLAGILRVTARHTDSVFRFGGDEFAVLLREAGLQEAVQLAARVRLLVGRQAGRREDEVLPAFDVSIGCAAPRTGDVPADLLLAADQAMYTDKRNSRWSPQQ